MLDWEGGQDVDLPLSSMHPMHVRTCASSHVHGMCMACALHVYTQDVDLPLSEGEAVLVYASAPAPETWRIAQKPYPPHRRGLVPETYVQLQPFKATMLGMYYDPDSGMRLGRSELVAVDPERSTEDAW